MNCNRCYSKNYTKAGFTKGRQRYKCKDCSRYYSVEQKSTAVSKEKKRMALQMYLEGLGFNSIGRVLGVPHVSVLKWVRKYGESCDSLRSEDTVEVMEVDEMHTYISKKKLLLDLDCCGSVWKEIC